MDALQAYYDKDLVTYPIGSISYNSGIHIERNKRNGLKQNQHLYLARRRKEDMKVIGIPMKAAEGRPNKQDIVINGDWNIQTGEKPTVFEIQD